MGHWTVEGLAGSAHLLEVDTFSAGLTGAGAGAAISASGRMGGGVELE